MVYLTDIKDYVSSWIFSLLEFWNFLTTDGLASIIQTAADSIANSTDTSLLAYTFLSGISTIITLVFGADASLLEVLLGGSLFFYVTYQLITWFLNIVT